MLTRRNWAFRILTVLLPLLAAALNGCMAMGPAEDDWSLVWSEEFSGGSLDTSVWNCDIGTGSSGWGNNELEYYTSRPENIRIEDLSPADGGGRGLVIEAREENYGGCSYTSARIHTKGKKEITYGKIEARIKLPAESGTSRGIWPAFWMLGGNIDASPWPVCGEIDIMELVGSETDRVHGTLHYGNPMQNTGQLTGANHFDLDSGDFGDAFHTFAVIWEPGAISWLVDGAVYFRQTSWYSSLPGSNAPFDRPFFLLLNLAVGGNWPGSPDGNTIFPKRMLVDYVRVYQK
jgi:beta-glucanase (GH16 family)